MLGPTAASENKMPGTTATTLMLIAVIGHYFCSYFSSIFDPTSFHIPYPTFLLYAYLGYVYLRLCFMLFTLTNR